MGTTAANDGDNAARPGVIERRDNQGAAERRTELGGLLRTRRTQLSRAELGLPATSRRRTSGLRREEVAYLSGVSVTWYTWLEQGRDTNPSRQVLDAIARTLRLSPAEHAYLLSLAGYSAPQPTPVPPTKPPAAHVQRLLDALTGHPAYAITPTWDISAWNPAYAALYPGIATVAAPDRNLLWLVFTDPAVRDLLPDWEITSQHFLAEFRAEAGPRLNEPAYTHLIDRLCAASVAFQRGWNNHLVEGFTSRERLFRHPIVGGLHFEHHRLAPSDQPGLHIVIYTPAPGTDTPARLHELLTTPPAST